MVIHRVIPPAMHGGSDSFVAVIFGPLHGESHDTAMVVVDLMELGLVGELFDFYRAESRPIEVQGNVGGATV